MELYLEDQIMYRIYYRIVGDMDNGVYCTHDLNESEVAQSYEILFTSGRFWDIQVVKMTTKFEVVEPPILH